jgi:hypothetical protein
VLISINSGGWGRAVFGSFSPQGRLQLGPEVTHCQFVQSGQVCCCLCQAAAMLPYSCNSVWSAPLLARWGSSVLSTVLSPSRLAQPSTTVPLWEVGLSPHPPLSVFVAFPAFIHWELGTKGSAPCPTPIFWGKCSISLPSTIGVRLQFAIYAFQFC